MRCVSEFAIAYTCAFLTGCLIGIVFEFYCRAFRCTLTNSKKKNDRRVLYTVKLLKLSFNRFLKLIPFRKPRANKRLNITKKFVGTLK